MDYTQFERTAANIRTGIIKAVHNAGSGHPGGSLSAADLVTALYFKEMNIDPKNPKMEGRDKFILSKGHAAPAQYAALAERGYFPKEDLCPAGSRGTAGRTRMGSGNVGGSLQFGQSYRYCGLERSAD